MRSRLECCGVLSSSGVYWDAGAFTLSDDIALGFALAFAFGLAPSSGVGIPSVDRALLAPLAFGFAFALVGVLGAVAGSSVVFTVAVGMALAAAFLNAAFNYCLGCEMYLLGLRFTSK